MVENNSNGDQSPEETVTLAEKGQLLQQNVPGIIPSYEIQFRAMASCLMPAGQLQGCHVITIEGLDPGYANPLQQAFINRGASQCGFCTPGFILSLTAYFLSGQNLTVQGALNSMACII